MSEDLGMSSGSADDMSTSDGQTIHISPIVELIVAHWVMGLPLPDLTAPDVTP